MDASNKKSQRSPDDTSIISKVKLRNGKEKSCSNKLLKIKQRISASFGRLAISKEEAIPENDFEFEPGVTNHYRCLSGDRMTSSSSYSSSPSPLVCQSLHVTPNHQKPPIPNNNNAGGGRQPNLIQCQGRSLDEPAVSKNTIPTRKEETISPLYDKYYGKSPQNWGSASSSSGVCYGGRLAGNSGRYDDRGMGGGIGEDQRVDPHYWVDAEYRRRVNSGGGLFSYFSKSRDEFPGSHAVASGSSGGGGGGIVYRSSMYVDGSASHCGSGSGSTQRLRQQQFQQQHQLHQQQQSTTTITTTTTKPKHSTLKRALSLLSSSSSSSSNILPHGKNSTHHHFNFFHHILGGEKPSTPTISTGVDDTHQQQQQQHHHRSSSKTTTEKQPTPQKSRKKHSGVKRHHSTGNMLASGKNFILPFFNNNNNNTGNSSGGGGGGSGGGGGGGGDRIEDSSGGSGRSGKKNYLTRLKTLNNFTSVMSSSYCAANDPDRKHSDEYFAGSSGGSRDGGDPGSEDGRVKVRQHRPRSEESFSRDGMRNKRASSFGSNSQFGKMKAYEKLEQLGEGSYATVYKGISLLTSKVVALKEIRLQSEEGTPFTAIREASLLKGLKHANIVTLHDIIHTKESLTFVFEFLNTDLGQYLERYPGGINPKNVKLFMFQLLRGLQFCHRRQILHSLKTQSQPKHNWDPASYTVNKIANKIVIKIVNKIINRDLKPQNLLISEIGELKLADFGLARAKSVPSRTYSNEVVTLWYRPPDVLLGSTDYTTSLDMWGVGCIFTEMISGNAIFPGMKDNLDQLDHIWKVLGTATESNWEGVTSMPNYDLEKFGMYPPKKLIRTVPKLASIPYSEQLAEHLLQVEPKKRIDSYNALHHKYFYDMPTKLYHLSDVASIFNVSSIKLSPEVDDLLKIRTNQVAGLSISTNKNPPLNNATTAAASSATNESAPLLIIKYNTNQNASDANLCNQANGKNATTNQIQIETKPTNSIASNKFESTTNEIAQNKSNSLDPHYSYSFKGPSAV